MDSDASTFTVSISASRLRVHKRTSGCAQYTVHMHGDESKQSMELDESSDTLLNRLAQLERLVQVQNEEIRRISLERDLFAAWYGTMKKNASRSERIVAEECAP